MTRFAAIICLILCCLLGKAQHFPIYSQYMLNGLAINPAYAGSRDVLSTSIMYRKQWMGFDGAPVTATLSAHTPLKNRKIGLGLHVITEKIGISNNISFFGNYAYRVRMGLGHMSFGLKFGTEILKEDYSQITTRKADDVAFSNTESFVLPNFGFGAYYFTNDYFVGLSIPSFLSYKQASGSKFEAYNDIKNYNFLLTGGYLFWITNTFKLKPSTLIRYHANSPVQFDLNLNAILLKDGLLWLGMSYRNKEALVGLVEFQMGTKWRMGLSYDYSLGPISKYSSGTIEAMLRMELITVVKTINPRFF
jgi:type IX secretion system PorP/SprF family membrane protein